MGMIKPIVRIQPTPSGSIVSTSFADNETPSGTVNGVNDTFTLAHTPIPAGSLQLTVNGQLMKANGTDYTLTTNSIVFVTAPPTGSIIIAWYRYWYGKYI